MEESKVSFDSKNILKFLVAFAVMIVLSFGFFAFRGSSSESSDTSNVSEIQLTDDLNQSLVEDDILESVEDLQIEDIVTGTGDEAVSGKSVTVHYTGTLTNGTKFDSSLDRDEPFSFNLGSGMVIKGWEEGIVGMKVGGTRKLTIPPSMAYGTSGTPDGSIPPNSTLIFEVELLGVE